MIIVTGTKRSGTSMWMQALAAGGFETISEPFSRGWERTIKGANERGFHESALRRGIYFATNPHPVTGAYLHPEATRTHAVKVFVPGLVRSDPAFLHLVIGTVRHWREYAESLDRLHAMERDEGGAGPRRMNPALEWWFDNYRLIRDIALRGYSAHLCTYDRMLTAPRDVLEQVFGRLGRGDLDAAVAAIAPELRTQRLDATAASGTEVPATPDLPAEIDRESADVFDELYARIDNREVLNDAFMKRLNNQHARLAERIDAELKAANRDAQRRRAERDRQRSLALLGSLAERAEAPAASMSGEAAPSADE